MFSPDYYSKLDPSYLKALRQLESEFKEPKSDEAQNALKDFTGKFMVSQKLWNLNGNKYPFGPFFGRVAVQYFLLKDITLKNPGNKCYDYEDKAIKINPYHLSFPHKDLEERMENYGKKIHSFIPPKIRLFYKAMKELYLKIKEAEGDLDEWFDALMETNDHQFVCDNVEYQLGMDLTDKKLWKKYINYLKEHDDEKLLLETYSKYCRFFLDDSEMMEEYGQAAVQYGRPVFVPWRKPYDFECTANQFWEIEAGALKIREPAVSCSSGKKPPLTVFYDGQNATKPDFPFLSPALRYILDHANGEVLQKLFKSSKWFYAAKPITVCYKFEERTYKYLKPRQRYPIDIKEQSIASVNNSILQSKFDQILISHIFSHVDCNSNAKALSNLMPKMYQCTAKYVEIYNQKLSMEELQYFIGHAVDLFLKNVYDSDGKEFCLEDILQLTPKIRRLTLQHVACTTETSEKLCDLQFKNKIDHIELRGMKADLLTPEQFANFIKKNCSSSAQIKLFFGIGNSRREYIKQLRQVLRDAIDEKWNGDVKPEVAIFESHHLIF